MPDRFEDLRVFAAVVETGGIAAAAKRLRVAKSAVSRRVRDLEDRLGARLLDRTTRSMHLTDAGRVLHERALSLLVQLDDAEEEAAGIGGGLRGTLRIAAPVSFTAHCLAPVLGRFLELHPKVELAIDTDDRMVDLVKDGFDMAIRIARLADSSLIARRLTEIRHACVIAPALVKRLGTPQTPDDLSRFPGIVYSNVEAAHYWTFADEIVPAVGARLAFANGDAIMSAAIAGVGAAVLPTFIVHDAVRRGELKIILAEHMRPSIAVHTLHASARNQSARARAFIDFLVETYAGEPFWDRGLSNTE